ncbi:glycosyltransferase family 4 protein [Mesorhizobium sp.]|uniref:glycosyltransferase family 4 protein n=1 Tax=Mesorhizobium sp. TaxID=1871066 RepID=UPI000FE5A4D2|nr:MAG: glycosyltransferase [Mesorhizobium sp.]RWM81892.1 MAG: glycosyltransferase [Mesorhizobium sp.]
MAKTAPHKIVRIIGLNQGGGARIHCRQLNDYIEETGRQTVTFIPPSPFSDPLTKTKNANSIYIERLSVAEIFLYITRHRSSIEYVHIHLKNAVILFSWIAILCRLPLIVTVHQEVVSKSLKSSLSNRMYAFFLRRATSVISISNYIKAQLNAIGVNSTMIWNASEDVLPHARKREPNDDRTLVIGVVGELTARKGVEDLCELTKLVPPECTFAVYGVGPLSSILIGVRGVELRGYESDRSVIYSSIDVLLMLSHGEPFGRVLTEAMANSLPVIARHSGGAIEVVDREWTFNTLGECAELVSKLRCRRARSEVGASNREKFTSLFSLDVFYRRLKEFGI